MTGPSWWTPPCVCGHDQGRHASNRSSWPHPLTYGVCLHMDTPHEISTICGCKEYTADESASYGAAA